MKPLGVVFLTLFCALLTSVGQLVLKAGVSKPALVVELASRDALTSFIRALSSPVVLVGLFFYALSAALWLLVLARADVSYAFPLVGASFVFTAVCANVFLHEP